jgi:hypothetical protein
VSRRLSEALSRFRRPVGRSIGDGGFRAATEERLRGLERELAEVKARVNGLLFLVAGAVVVQVVLGLSR